jgi:hypothetical protein
MCDCRLHETSRLPCAQRFILQRANHFETSAISNVRKARIGMSAEIALVDANRQECADQRPRPTLPIREFYQALLSHAVQPCG